jgi:hypothetical protein
LSWKNPLKREKFFIEINLINKGESKIGESKLSQGKEKLQ